jgi:hypothetical protein
MSRGPTASSFNTAFIIATRSDGGSWASSFLASANPAPAI